MCWCWPLSLSLPSLLVPSAPNAQSLASPRPVLSALSIRKGAYTWIWAFPPTPELYTIKVTGEIDISNADSLRNAIDLALEQPTEAVELDFAQVSYIDSTGIGVLVGAAHHAVDHGKRFSCTNVQPPVMRVVQLLGVDQEISITAA